jgi:hypothetical protein
MNLRNFAEIIEADEVLLFERATFLVKTFYSTDKFYTVSFSDQQQRTCSHFQEEPFFLWSLLQHAQPYL